jgi:hypothetical protein
MRNRQRQSMQFHNLSEDECPKGRFRKRHPLDCGRAKCKLCHGEKLYGKRSVKGQRADQAFASQLQELSV